MTTSIRSGTSDAGILINGVERVTIDATGITSGYGDNSVTPSKLSQKLTSATAQATTSGTAKDFTGIPSWAKRITISFNAVSLSATANLLIQGGVSGVPETTGYSSASTGVTGVAGGTVSSTAGWIMRVNTAAGAITGHMVLTQMSTNLWISSHAITPDASTASGVGGGSKTFAGVLDTIRITSTSTDTLDAGSVNIMWE